MGELGAAGKGMRLGRNKGHGRRRIPPGRWGALGGMGAGSWWETDVRRPRGLHRGASERRQLGGGAQCRGGEWPRGLE